MRAPSLAAGLFAVLAASSAPAAPPAADNFHDPALSARLDGLLADLLGPGRARAFVRRRPRASPVAGAQAPESPSELWERVGDLRAEKDILPGFPLPLTLGEAARLALAERASAPPASLEALLFIDAALDDAKIEPAVKAASSALGLDADRGDSARVLRAPFLPPAAPAPALPPGPPPWRAALAAAGLAALAALAWAARPALARRRSRRCVASAPDDVFWLRAALTRRHAPEAARLLAAEGAAAAARALAWLEPSVAADVFSRLSAPLRLEVAATLLLPAPGVGATVADRLADRAQRHDRGPGLLQSLLARVPERVREGVLSGLSDAAPDIVRDLRAALPTLETAAHADAETLSLCLRPLSREELALFLYEAPDALVEAALSGLPALVRDQARARARHLVPATLQAVSEVRSRVFGRWSSLIEQGRARPLCA